MNYKSGITPLVKVGEFGEKFNLPNLLVKDESKNPFGTWKDRRSELIITKAQKESVNKLCLITAGNAGFSLVKFAEGTDIEVVLVIDKDLPESIKIVLKNECKKVVEIDLVNKMLSSEELIALARENDKEVIWDVTNRFDQAYESIIGEVEGSTPDYLVCPLGSGEAFVGMYNGINKYHLKTKLIGVRPMSNPSFADKLPTSWMLYQKEIEAIVQDGHTVIELSEDQIRSAYEYAKNYIDCEPSSAVIIGALSMIKFKENDKIVGINSGKGLI